MSSPSQRSPLASRWPRSSTTRRPAEASAGGIDLVANRDGRSGVSEAYRGLRTSILLSNPGCPPRQIVLTSALPEDGKVGLLVAEMVRDDLKSAQKDELVKKSGYATFNYHE